MNKKLFLIMGLTVLVLLAIGMLSFSQRGENQVASNPTVTGTGTSTTVHNPVSTSTVLPVPSSQQASIGAEYIVTEPHALMLVDSQGRRTGKDPATGTRYHEIPNTNYVEEAVNPGHPVGELFTSDLPSGQYTLYVLGGKTGFYGFDIALNGRLTQSFTGNIQNGSMIAYVQNYDSSNLASSTFSFSATSSSTASITSATPNNLPPPPVPK